MDIGAPAIALTDHGLVAGHLDFGKTCGKHEIKPIFGTELYHGLHFGIKKPKRDQAHLIVLAQTDEGLKNLWRLNNVAAQESRFYFVGRNTWEDFEKNKEGLWITSACPASLVNKGIMRDDYTALNQYLDIFGDNFFLELSTYPMGACFDDNDIDEPVTLVEYNNRIVSVAQERGIRLTYGDDGHFAFPYQSKAFDLLVARNTGDTLYTPISERKMYHPEDALCIKSEDDVREALCYLSESVVDEAIETTQFIGEQADAHLPDVRRHLPVFIPDNSPWVKPGKYKDDAADELFVDLVLEGMYECYSKDPTPRVIEQTVKETEIFIEAGLHHYFLMDWDMIQFCKDKEIEIGPGRGSAAGCIVARELGITDIDPLPYNLSFERFWNAGRAKGFPDIDTDIEKRRRREVKEYLSKRWGHDNVRSIGTVTRMKPKSVIEKLYKACGVSWDEHVQLKAIVEQTPDLEILGVDQIGWTRSRDPGKVYYVEEEVGDQIIDWIQEQPSNRQEKLAEFVEYCSILCNRVANYGVHASGIVVSDAPLADIAPSRFAGSPDQRIPVTQFAMDDIDKLLLIKLDLLGLRTLDVLSDWKAQMKEQGADVTWSQLEWEKHDDAMWKLMEDGFAAGIFQIEKGYPKKLAEEFKPKSVEDLAIIVSLNRPGPIRSGAPASFIKRRAGIEEIEYDDEILREILNKTYGWFLYQESVIEYFNRLGYSKSDSDVVRKILGKKQPEKWVDLYHGRDEWEGKGYIEMAAKAGVGDISKTIAAKWNGEDVRDDKNQLVYSDDAVNAWIIWVKIVDFAKYSFNASHAVAYGTIGFRALFAKYNGPAEFYTACIRNVDKNKKAEQMPLYINEARRWGIKVHPPDILNSKSQVSIKDNEIYFGFMDVKDISSQQSADFLVELRESEIDLSSPEKLFEHIEVLTKERETKNKELVKQGLPKLTGKSPKQTLNAKKVESLYTAGAWERIENGQTPLAQLQAREKEMLGVILSDDTDEAFENNMEQIYECASYDEALESYEEDTTYRLPGIISNIKEVKSKASNKKMGVITIEYEGNSLEFIVFPEQWKSHRFLWRERVAAIFNIRHAVNPKTGLAGYNFESGEKLSA